MPEEKPEEQITPSASTPVTRRRGNGSLFLLMLVLLAAVAAGGWYGWQLSRALQHEDAQQRQSLAQLRESLQRLEQAQAEQGEDRQESLDALEGRLAAQREQLQQMRAGGQTDWLLNEAEALASLSQQRLLLTGDIAAARRLLQAADDVLKRVDLPEAISARKAVAIDLEKLRGAEAVDVAGVVMRIDALREQVAGLTVPAAKRADTDETEVAGDEVEGLQYWLKKLPIKMRPRDESLPLPLDAAQASLLRLSLNTDLQKAQLAALQARPQVYEAALADAGETLSSWFAADGPAGSLQSALDELRQVHLARALPAIGEGLSAIRGLIAERGERQ